MPAAPSNEATCTTTPWRDRVDVPLPVNRPSPGLRPLSPPLGERDAVRGFKGKGGAPKIGDALAEPATLPCRTAPETAGESRSVLRHGAWDVPFIGLALVHGALLLSLPSIPLIGIGLWWNANTISHNFIHGPFFRSRALNAAFSCCLSLLLGLPQLLWRDRHLAHHADRPWQWRWSKQLVVELALVTGLWAVLLVLAPRFLVTVYLPGLLLGLGLCHLQGRFEHEHGTTSHYGRLYNLLFFNDGYHVEHHARPGGYWRDLPKRIEPSAKRSRWPAVLRWLNQCNLDGLERLVLRSKTLQRFVLETHERAFRALLPALPKVGRVGIVGGGLFPRTALVLQRILPDARITVIEADADNLMTAKHLLNGSVHYVHERFDGSPRHDYDLLVIPLAFDGRRAAIYRHPPASAVLVHDWFWRTRGTSKVVSWWLLKRMNLVRR